MMGKEPEGAPNQAAGAQGVVPEVEGEDARFGCGLEDAPPCAAMRSTSRPTASEVLLRSTVLPIGRSSMRFGVRPRGAFGAAKPALVHGPMEAHEAAALCDQFLRCDG